MAGDCFIRIQGKVQGKFVGEAHDREFEGAIDVETWNWGGSRELGSAMRQKSALALSELAFTHRVDAATIHSCPRCRTPSRARSN